MIGRVGTVFGRHGINIVSAAVGRQPESAPAAGAYAGLAAMVITTDVAVAPPVLEEIVSGEGFVAGRTVDL
jgi:D-3-phosphoglycerate dehydrogenase